MFNFIKDTLKKVYTQFTAKVHTLFGLATVDEATLKELERLLIGADAGIKTTQLIINNLRTNMQQGKLASGNDLRIALEQQLLAILTEKTVPTSSVYLLVGINGSGKTTCAGKLAHQLSSQGKRVLLVAADTFRAAAVEQLTIWAQRSNTEIITGTTNQEPASVVFSGCDAFKKGNYDVLIIDTAGRLQTKVNLMKELEKIKKIVERQLPETTICTLLTIDAMLGQNSLEQARLFNESTQLNGIILTKMDGTGKGGIVFSICQELHIPIAYLSFGEKIDQLKIFNAQEYVSQLMRE